jgi:hypothetical protein
MYSQHIGSIASQQDCNRITTLHHSLSYLNSSLFIVVTSWGCYYREGIVVTGRSDEAIQATLVLFAFSSLVLSSLWHLMWEKQHPRHPKFKQWFRGTSWIHQACHHSLTVLLDGRGTPLRHWTPSNSVNLCREWEDSWVVYEFMTYCMICQSETSL